MKLKITITGPKVHDVGYRYFLINMAMSSRIRMFEAHNMESEDHQEVHVFLDGEDKAVEAFRALVKSRRPARSEVSNISFEDFEGRIMRIGEYAQFCSIVQLNKAIPVLLDMRDDIKEMKTDVKEMKTDIKEIKTDIKEMKTDIKVVRKTTDDTLEEIRGMREDIQPGYGMSGRQVQSDIRAIKERLTMA